MKYMHNHWQPPETVKDLENAIRLSQRALLRERINEVQADSGKRFDTEVGVSSSKLLSKNISPASHSPRMEDIAKVEMAKP